VTAMSETLPAIRSYQLLGHPADLDGHCASLGPLALPGRRTRGWREAFGVLLAASGLAGRGGAGFPAARKLAVAQKAGPGGIVLVNGMESEPASDKDKLLLIRSPHLVLDGAQLLAAACDARRIVVCIPDGRDHVAAAVGRAIAERTAARYPRAASEELQRPPDRFIAGEESALAQWVQSGLVLPSFRPEKGTALRIGRGSALVHNAETLAHVAMIERTGPDAFRSRGLPDDPGTSLVTIGGAVTRPGVVEIDRGTPLLEIVARAAPADPPRALLVGGYGGSWLGPEHFATPYTSSSLRAVGAAAGVGVVIALGPAACGVAESARIAAYLAGQGAGQCGPCVYGLPAIAHDLAHLVRGRGDAGLLARLEGRLRQVEGRGACGHPDGAVRLVRSALRVFASDVMAHGAGAPCAHTQRASQLRFPAHAMVA
jgi:NADH:ubiquinone oxidoreductase subunit F (NADH-binding)